MSLPLNVAKGICHLRPNSIDSCRSSGETDPTMPSFAKIIAVQRSHNKWEVWFEGAENITALARTRTDAIFKLCDFYGADQFVMTSLERIKGELGATRQEFRIQLRSTIGLARPSSN